MKHFRILFPLLILALVLSGCGKQVQQPYEYTYSGTSGTVTLTVYPESGTITNGLDVYTYEAEYNGDRSSYEITYPNGATFHWSGTEHGGAGGWSGDYNENLYISGDILISALEQTQPRQRVGNFGVGLLVIGLGAVNFFLPELPFYLRYGWAVENAEPSDAYITWTKVCGAIAAIAGLIYCFI